MTGLSALWLPIVLSAVFVFVASSIIHMAPLWHRNDYPKMPGEEAFRAAVGPLGVPPGDYMVPRAASGAEMKSPEFQEKLERGPVVILTMLPAGKFAMGGPLAMWFVYSLVISLFAGYMASRGVPPGGRYLDVFQYAGTTAFLGYAGALWQMSIWYRRSWSMTLKSTFDGLVYAGITAGTLGWLWPR